MYMMSLRAKFNIPKSQWSIRHRQQTETSSKFSNRCHVTLFHFTKNTDANEVTNASKINYHTLLRGPKVSGVSITPPQKAAYPPRHYSLQETIQHVVAAASNDTTLVPSFVKIG